MSRRELVAALVVSVVATACVRHAGPAGGTVRGLGPGWRSEPHARSSKLSVAGAGVLIVPAPSAECTQVGYVTGVAMRDQPRPVGLSRAEWEATLPWTEADIDARNLAAAHGVAELVIDAKETQERRGEHEGNIGFRTYALVHSRAFRCPPAH